MTHSLIENILTVLDFEMIFPPEIFVVEGVVLVEKDHVVGQFFDATEIGCIDERSGGCNLFVVAVKTYNDWNDGMVHHSEEPT